MTPDGYELVVGLEVHVQLRTRSKLFCDCPNRFGDPPNTNTCPVCLGLPGALPVTNRHAVELGVRAAIALGCDVQGTSVFTRKNYFYPDLPKGYQISQFDRPLATGGGIAIAASGATPRVIRLTRIHLEEDAGKSIHDRYPGATAVDLNRAGTPLIEIVSEPDLRSASEAREYLHLLKEVLEYAEISDASMEEGSLRVDANVSVRPSGSEVLGTKAEVKNLNSFANVERAIEMEAARQVAIIAAGGRVAQETLLYDAGRGALRAARSKEESQDYRYFPEPDLPALVVSADQVDGQRLAIPELPVPRRARLQAALGIGAAEAGVLTSTRPLAEFYEQVANLAADGRVAASWVGGEVLAWLNDHREAIGDLRVTPAALAGLLDLVRDGVLSRNAARSVFQVMAATGEAASVVVEREGLRQVGDDASLAAWIDEVLAACPDEARRFLTGEGRLLGVLVGLVMKRSGGRANPGRVNQLLRERVR